MPVPSAGTDRDRFCWAGALTGLLALASLEQKQLAQAIGATPQQLSEWVVAGTIPALDRVVAIGGELEKYQPGAARLLLAVAGYASPDDLRLRTAIHEALHKLGPKQETNSSERRGKWADVMSFVLETLSGEPSAFVAALQSSGLDEALDIAHVGLFGGDAGALMVWLNSQRVALGRPTTQAGERRRARILRILARVRAEALPRRQLARTYEFARAARDYALSCDRIVVSNRNWLNADALLGEMMVERMQNDARRAPPARFEDLCDRFQDYDLRALKDQRDEHPLEAILVDVTNTYALLGAPESALNTKRARRSSESAIQGARDVRALAFGTSMARAVDGALAMALDASARVKIRFLELDSSEWSTIDEELEQAKALAARSDLPALRHRARRTAVKKALKESPTIAGSMMLRDYLMQLRSDAPTERTRAAINDLRAALG